jgi:hypothetical protein
MLRTMAACGALAGLMVMATEPAAATGGGDPYSGTQAQLSTRGSHIDLVAAETLRSWAAETVRGQGDGPWYEYATVSPCGGYPGRIGSDDLCGYAVGLCVSQPGDGPAVAIFRREVDADGAPVRGRTGDWESLGITCFPELVPGAGNVLTMAMIRRAFHDTDFAVPSVNIQPEGDVTLVNLPTYFEVRFPESGFGPDEVDTPDPATLLGHRIQVRPRLKSVTYHLGTRTVGPTTDLGGPYPSGDVVETYAQAGPVEVRVDIVYTGQFRVSGSDWFDIPGEVDLEGTTVTLDVREARARLYGSGATAATGGTG